MPHRALWVHRLFPAPSKMWSSACTRRGHQGAEGSITSPRLEALLDKLVAVQLDLDPISRSGGRGAESDKIANASKVLHSAIGDFREIIREVDGLDLSGVR